MNTIVTKLNQYLLIFIILFSAAFQLNAQNKNTSINKIYLQAGTGASSSDGSFSSIGLYSIIKNKWSLGLSYYGLTMKPANLPSDYRPETGFIFLIPYTKQIKVSMTQLNLTAGRYFILSQHWWVNTEFGFSLVNGEKATFKPSSVNDMTDFSSLLIYVSPSNYSYTLSKNKSIGGVANADLNWAFSSFMGLGCGVFANFNSIQTTAGFQIHLTAGLMRSKKKK
jgi:hypothetical protein